MVDLQQLYHLVVIEEEGNLSAAAERLHLSQSALSRSMQRLEAELGLTLFERRKNRLVFGDLGKKAAEDARSLLKEAQRYVDGLQDYALHLSLVRIASSSPAPLWRLTTEIHERFPAFIVTEELGSPEQLLEGLRSGYFRLILSHEQPQEPGLLCRKYLEERLLLELPPDHPLASRHSLAAADLKGLTVLRYRNLGVWEERLPLLEGLHMIEQTELDVLVDLALSSGLPMLSSSSAPTPSANQGGRVTLPILDEAAVLPLYLCARREDQDLFSRFC